MVANLNLENKRMLDVVDDKDQVIDSRSREEIHKRGLLHRDIHVWMFDRDNNIYFQKRGVSVLWAGLLDATVGGHLNKGESYIDAAIRETEEETGIKVSNTDLVFLKKFKSVMNLSDWEFPRVVNNFFRHLYVYKYPVDEKDLTEEEGILGVSFQKLSIDFLKNMNKKDESVFAECVVKDELPEVMKYLKNLRNQ